MESNLIRDKHAKLCSTVNAAIEALRPDSNEDSLLDAAEQVVSRPMSMCIHSKTVVEAQLFRSKPSAGYLSCNTTSSTSMDYLLSWMYSRPDRAAMLYWNCSEL